MKREAIVQLSLRDRGGGEVDGRPALKPVEDREEAREFFGIL